MRFNPDEYITIGERIEKFYAKFPNGRILTSIVEHDAGTGFVLVRAEVYRETDDALPAATGHAYETKSAGAAQAGSYVEVCETSAVGRAIMLLGFEVKRQPAQRQPARQQPATSDKQPVSVAEKLADAHGRIRGWRKKLRDEGFETATTLDAMLKRFEVAKVEDLNYKNAMAHGVELKALYENHVTERVQKLANKKETPR